MLQRGALQTSSDAAARPGTGQASPARIQQPLQNGEPSTHHHQEDGKAAEQYKQPARLSNPLQWKVSLPMAGGWNSTSFKVPSNPNHSLSL